MRFFYHFVLFCYFKTTKNGFFLHIYSKNSNFALYLVNCKLSNRK